MSGNKSTPFEGPGPDQVFLQHLSEGRLYLQRCRDTGRYVFFPRVLSPFTGKPNLEWVPASGEGVVYSTTVIRRRKEAGGDYNIALVDLAEGVRMMSRVEGLEPAEVGIGLKVKARIITAGDRPIVVFDPAGGR
ncbi:MAG: OB-fold domain-containing protein [Proteobacteria bacterium]|nr:OB-fold domain-containing protein [Pseudomonadota bacterium]MBI3499113.1 OB-fold domain-containing protein [Pseudomonadota bacterium]